MILPWVSFRSPPRFLSKEHLPHILHYQLPWQTKNELKGNQNHTRQKNEGKAHWSRYHDLAQAEEMLSLIRDKEILIDPHPWGLCLQHKIWPLIFKGKGATYSYSSLQAASFDYKGIGEALTTVFALAFSQTSQWNFKYPYRKCQIGL